MFPDSLLYWLGGTALLVGVLGLVGLLALWVDHKVDRWHWKRHNQYRSKPDDERQD